MRNIKLVINDETFEAGLITVWDNKYLDSQDWILIGGVIKDFVLAKALDGGMDPDAAADELREI